VKRSASLHGLVGSARVIAWVACAMSTNCGMPGIRPGGRAHAVAGSVPSTRDALFARARAWFDQSEFVTTHELPALRLQGYSIIRRVGDRETRAILEFSITRSSANETAYLVESRTEEGTPPTFTRLDTNAREAVSAANALIDWLSCASARWPRCP
jgi:hypothetical protein